MPRNDLKNLPHSASWNKHRDKWEARDLNKKIRQKVKKEIEAEVKIENYQADLARLEEYDKNRMGRDVAYSAFETALSIIYELLKKEIKLGRSYKNKDEEFSIEFKVLGFEKKDNTQRVIVSSDGWEVTIPIRIFLENYKELPE